MPGTYVTDANAPVLANAVDVSATGAQAAVAVRYLDRCRAKLTVAAITGTNPEVVISIEASDDSTFASGVVTLGSFYLVTADASSTRWIDVPVRHSHVRANVVDIQGTSPVFNDVTIRLEEAHYQETKTDTA